MPPRLASRDASALYLALNTFCQAIWTVLIEHIAPYAGEYFPAQAIRDAIDNMLKDEVRAYAHIKQLERSGCFNGDQGYLRTVATMEHELILLLVRLAKAELSLISFEQLIPTDDLPRRLDVTVSSMVRAEARSQLFRALQRVTSPRLAGIDYRRDILYHDDDEEDQPDKEEDEQDEAMLAWGLYDMELNTTDDEICPICQESLAGEADIEDIDREMAAAEAVATETIHTPCCGKAFHAYCLLRWIRGAGGDALNKDCPLCREEFGEEFSIEQYAMRIASLRTL
ncbi:hypothetical protein LTS15_001599 [Exophiala xenobiotica]|nr:hypothetical protein LTS15_001599 [Exophiala xenobiotica]